MIVRYVDKELEDTERDRHLNGLIDVVFPSEFTVHGPFSGGCVSTTLSGFRIASWTTLEKTDH